MSGRVLAVRQDNHGDVLLTGPALRALKAAGKRVILIAGAGGVAAARLMPEVDDVLVMPAEWIALDPPPIRKQVIDERIKALASLFATEAFIFTSFHQSPLPMALLLRLAGVERVHAISEDYPGSLLDTRARVDDGLHEVERNLALVAQAGYSPDIADRKLRLRTLPPVARLGLPASYVVIHPGATVPARAWPPVHNRALAADLIDAGYDVVVTGSAAEVDLCRFVAGECAARNLCGLTSFGEWCSVVAGAAAVVSGNTAAAHVAAAAATPVVSIFPPTIPVERFRPWNVPHVTLGDQAIPCAGCRARACPVPGQPCIGTISTGDVLASLRSLGVLPAGVAA